MFDIGAPEVLVVLIVALLVFGPDRLPEMARQAGSWIRDLRRMVAKARHDLSDGLGVDAADLRKLQNLDPKSYVRRNVLDGVDLDLDLGLDDDDAERPRRGNGTAKTPRSGTATSGSGAATSGSGTTAGGAEATPGASAPMAAPAPYDPDAT
ncbi:MAG: sec-independent translocase [Jiangellaceae bacterium]